MLKSETLTESPAGVMQLVSHETVNSSSALTCSPARGDLYIPPIWQSTRVVSHSRRWVGEWARRWRERNLPPRLLSGRPRVSWWGAAGCPMWKTCLPIAVCLSRAWKIRGKGWIIQATVSAGGRQRRRRRRRQREQRLQRRRKREASGHHRRRRRRGTATTGARWEKERATTRRRSVSSHETLLWLRNHLPLAPTFVGHTVTPKPISSHEMGHNSQSKRTSYDERK